MPPTQITVGPVAFTVNNTVVTSDNNVLLWDGTNAVTVPWTITHSPYGSPVFDVTVAIYPVGSTSPVKTFLLEDQPLSEDPSSLEWEGETDPDPPGEVAPPGVYRYKVTALHVGEGPGCTDTDKSTSLTISNVTLSDFEWIPDTHPPQAKVWLEWDLSIDAESSKLEIYAPCLNDVEILVPSDKELAPTAGHHFRWVYFEVCPAHMGNYTFVIYAGETAATGQTHRDTKPKPALQGGAVLPIWPPAYAGAGEDGPQSPLNEYYSQAAEAAAEELNTPDSSSGMRWASTWGAGPSQSDVVFGHMDTSPLGVLATVSHASPKELAFENGDPEDRNYLLEAELIELTFHSHGINELDKKDLSEVLFVLFDGCGTAEEIDIDPGLGPPDMHRPLCDAVMAKGAQVFAGFWGRPNAVKGVLFHQVFWENACQAGVSVAEACDEAVDRVEQVYGDSGWFASFWCTDGALELYPPRFSGACIGQQE